MTIARPFVLVLAILSLATLASCGSTRIAGRVVQGPAGLPIVVPATDTRITESRPVPQVKIQVVGEKGEVVATAISDEDGGFTLSMPSEATPTRAVEIRAKGPGVLDASGSIYLPRDGSWILFIVKPDSVASMSAPTS